MLSLLLSYLFIGFHFMLFVIHDNFRSLSFLTLTALDFLFSRFSIFNSSEVHYSDSTNLLSNFLFLLHTSYFSLLSSYYNFREINNIGKIRLCFSFTVEHDHEPFEDHRPVTCNSFTDGTTDEAFHHKTVGQSYIHK